MEKPKLINFRCPDDVWAEIDRIGTDRHPKEKDGFNLTATLLDILRVGLNAINENPDLLTDSKTPSKTEIEEMIRAAIGPIRLEVAEIKKH